MIEYKRIYEALWVMNYFHSTSPFHRRNVVSLSLLCRTLHVMLNPSIQQTLTVTTGIYHVTYSRVNHSHSICIIPMARISFHPDNCFPRIAALRNRFPVGSFHNNSNSNSWIPIWKELVRAYLPYRTTAENEKTAIFWDYDFQTDKVIHHHRSGVIVQDKRTDVYTPSHLHEIKLQHTHPFIFL